MVVFNSGEDEEPVACTRHLCRLEGLEARTAGLDDIMAAPEGPDRYIDGGALLERVRVTGIFCCYVFTADFSIASVKFFF